MIGKKSVLTIIFLLLIFILSRLCFNIEAKQKTETIYPMFSYTKYQSERKLICNLYKEDFEEIKNGYAGSITYVNIPIALVDLNNDGKNEVFAGLQHPFYSGSQYNTLLLLFVYREGQQELFHTFGITNMDIDNKNGDQRNVKIIMGKEKWKRVTVNKETWIWDGRKYKTLNEN